MSETVHQVLIDTAIERVLELEEDLELVEATVSGRPGNARLRVYIYRPEGVTVDDCARFSRRLSRELEAEEELRQTLTIEVSSPGLDRQLTTRRDFERVIGELLRVEVADNEGGQRTVRGILTGVEEAALLMDPPPPEKGRRDSGASNGKAFRISLEGIVAGKIEVVM